MYNKAQKRLYPVSEIEEDSDELSFHENTDSYVLKDITKINEFGINKEIEVQRTDSLLSNYQRVDSEIIGNPQNTTFEIDKHSV